MAETIFNKPSDNILHFYSRIKPIVFHLTHAYQSSSFPNGLYFNPHGKEIKAIVIVRSGTATTLSISNYGGGVYALKTGEESKIVQMIPNTGTFSVSFDFDNSGRFHITKSGNVSNVEAFFMMLDYDLNSPPVYADFTNS